MSLLPSVRGGSSAVTRSISSWACSARRRSGARTPNAARAGGSKWAVEAPYVIAAAKSLMVPTPKAILAYSWGDMSTHFLQLFWAIPLLAIAKVEFKEIIGYLSILFVVNFIVVSLALILFL